MWLLQRFTHQILRGGAGAHSMAAEIARGEAGDHYGHKRVDMIRMESRSLDRTEGRRGCWRLARLKKRARRAQEGSASIMLLVRFALALLALCSWRVRGSVCVLCVQCVADHAVLDTSAAGEWKSGEFTRG